MSVLPAAGFHYLEGRATRVPIFAASLEFGSRVTRPSELWGWQRLFLRRPSGLGRRSANDDRIRARGFRPAISEIGLALASKPPYFPVK